MKSYSDAASRSSRQRSDSRFMCTMFSSATPCARSQSAYRSSSVDFPQRRMPVMTLIRSLSRYSISLFRYSGLLMRSSMRSSSFRVCCVYITTARAKKQEVFDFKVKNFL